ATIQISLEPMEVTAGDAVCLKCQVAGTPEIKVSWFKADGKVRSSPTCKLEYTKGVACLKLSKATKSDIGEYTCKAENRIGSFSRLLNLYLCKNHWLFRLMSPVRFECRVAGSLPIEVSWLKDSKPLSQGEEFSMLYDDNTAVLQINNSEMRHSGEYTCVATNSVDWLISLSEAKKPPVFDVPLKPATVDDGEKLILRCHVCGSSPLKIQWMKDRKELTPSSSTRISFSDGTACLEISTVSKLNAGDYLCKATNEAGSEFCKAKVTVKGKKEKKEGTATFIAKVGGDPIPSVKWMKGKWRQVTHGGRISIEQKGQEAKLEIKEVTKSDSGQYRCVASNKHGEIEYPYFTVKLQDYTAVEKDEVVLDCELSKDVDVMWYHNEAEIKASKTVNIKAEGKRRVLIIKRVGDKDKGQYLCDCGTDKTTATLHIEESEFIFSPPGIPSPPIELHVTGASRDFLAIAWKPPQTDGGAPVRGYHIEMCEAGTEKWMRVNSRPVKELKYRVEEGVTPEKEYILRVRAVNAIGESEPSDISENVFPCRPITVPSPPVNPKVKDYSRATADLVWTKPTKDGGSPILGYTVEMKKASAEEWKKVNLDDLIKQCAYRVKGLEEGVTYRFRVFASNMIGDGEPREIPESVTAQDILIPPEIEMEATCRDCVTVRVGHNINIIGYIKARPDPEVFWSKEETILENSKRNDGGKSITGYILERKEKRAVRWVPCTKSPISERRMKVTNLIPNHEYQFRVRAENDVGLGDPSKPCRPVAAKDPIGEFAVTTLLLRSSSGGVCFVLFFCGRAEEHVKCQTMGFKI
uniref:Uncharacterized protein n=1 Tax=Pundamilia nyererei TaxID=303518 RepID=A0A3B4GC37_9CICH